MMRHKKSGDGAPRKISDLFAVYRKRLRAPQGSVIGAACEVIEDLTGIVVRKEACTYSPHGRILRIAIPGPKKSEIMMRREEILTHLKGRLGQEGAPTQIL